MYSLKLHSTQFFVIPGPGTISSRQSYLCPGKKVEGQGSSTYTNCLILLYTKFSDSALFWANKNKALIGGALFEIGSKEH